MHAHLVVRFKRGYTQYRKMNIFSQEKLEAALCKSIKQLIDMPEAYLFLKPVDLIKVKRYKEVIKHPIDLGTIKQNIENGIYHEPWQYINDIRLMFTMAWTFNRKNTYVYMNCSKASIYIFSICLDGIIVFSRGGYFVQLSNIFDTNIDAVMVSLGYCCGQNYSFEPRTLICSGKNMCKIKVRSDYYAHIDK
jgi:E1A/CREB-binding protein